MLIARNNVLTQEQIEEFLQLLYDKEKISEIPIVMQRSQRFSLMFKD